MSQLPAFESARAAVFHSPGESLELRNFGRPVLADQEVLVQVECCTLCGSDLHTYLGKRPGPAPSILGHEVLGRIVEFGPRHTQLDWRGEPLKVGDRISWAVAASCGACYFCHHELPQKCVQLFKYGHESCDHLPALSGGLADYCHLKSGSTILRVPPEIPDVVASSANCAVATVAAAHRVVGGCRDKVVLIQGMGLLGLTAVAMAVCDGAEKVLVADVEPGRLAMASRFGADVAVDLIQQPEQLQHEVELATGGRGVDVAFEMSGAADAVSQGLGLLRTGGCYVLVGAVRPIGTIPLDVEQVVRRMWRIQGVHNYAPIDLATAIDFLAANHQRFPFREQVSGVFSLDEVETAFHYMVETKAVRVAICPRPS